MLLVFTGSERSKLASPCCDVISAMPDTASGSGMSTIIKMFLKTLWESMSLGCIKRGIAGSNWCLRVKAFLFHCGSLLLAPQELNRCRHWKRSIQVRLTN